MNFSPYPKKPHIIRLLLTSLLSSITMAPSLCSLQTHQWMCYSEQAKVNHRAFAVALPLAGMVLPQILNQLSDTSSPIKYVLSSSEPPFPSAVRRFQREVVRTRICRLQSIRTRNNVWSHIIKQIHSTSNQTKQRHGRNLVPQFTKVSVISAQNISVI